MAKVKVKDTTIIHKDGSSIDFNIKGELTQNSIEKFNSVTDIQIGNGVTRIAQDAFSNNSNITSITASNSAINY